jgi:hypothetical protein
LATDAAIDKTVADIIPNSDALPGFDSLRLEEKLSDACALEKIIGDALTVRAKP